MTDATRVLNPVDVERGILEAANTVAEGVAVVSERLTTYRAAQRAFDLAWAHAFMNAVGAVETKKQEAVLATADQREALDVAEVAWRYAERKTRAAESTLSAYQSISRSVTMMYQSAGKGGEY